MRVLTALDSKAALFATLVGSAGRFGYLAGSVVYLATGSPISVIHAKGSKNNLDALHAVALLKAKFPPLDLRLLVAADGRLCARKIDAGKLLFASAYDPEAVFFLVAGNRYVVGLSSDLQHLSRQPDCTIKARAQQAGKWELLHYRDMTSDQGRHVPRYIIEDGGVLHFRANLLESLKGVAMTQLVAFVRSISWLV